MDDLAEQIRAWADSAAPSDEKAVQAHDVLAAQRPPLEPLTDASPARRRGHQLLLAAAVISIIGAVAVALAVSGRDGRDSTFDQPSDDTTAGSTSIPRAEVTFEVLRVHDSATLKMGTLRSASNPDDFATLWTYAGVLTTAPEIDFDKQVVVSITIPDDNCPPTLEGFRRDGSTLEPRFVEPPGGCDEPLIPKTFIVALDWATTGSSFRLFLPGQSSYEFGDAYLDIEKVQSEPIAVRLELESPTVPGGGEITGHVVVNNNSGSPIEAPACNSQFFAVTLESGAYKQEQGWELCGGQLTIPTGESSYPVTVRAIYTSCSNEGNLLGSPPCTDVGPPALPLGEYKAVVNQATEDLVPSPDPVIVTVTSP